MQSVSTFFNEKDDFLYKRGEKVKTQEVATSLILESDWSDEQIAHIVKVDVNYVKKLRTELNNK